MPDEEAEIVLKTAGKLCNGDWAHARSVLQGCTTDQVCYSVLGRLYFFPQSDNLHGEVSLLQKAFPQRLQTF